MKPTLIHSSVSGIRLMLSLLFLLGLSPACQGFHISCRLRATHACGTPQLQRTASSSRLHVVLDDTEDVVEKTVRLAQEAPVWDPDLDATVHAVFSQEALPNPELEYRVVGTLAQAGFTTANTLLATSLCSDEVAKTLVDDFVKIYGSTFNMGGLAGFPFSGNVGFQTMAGHIPDNGYCLLVYASHVGMLPDGTVGQVERENVSAHDNCCRSAMKACDRVLGNASGNEQAGFDMMDLQQSAVQNLVLPLAPRLQASLNPLLELPYGIYDTQTDLVNDILRENASLLKRGIAVLGGVQINTGPGKLDYFHPLRFQLYHRQGGDNDDDLVMQDLLPQIILVQ